MRTHLTMEQRQLALRLKARGLSLREIGPQVGCSHQNVALIVCHPSRRPVRRQEWVPGPGRLTLADREEITLGLHAGESFTVIAARLDKAVSTVSREVAANGGRHGYRAWRAHQRAREQARRAEDPEAGPPSAGSSGHQLAGRLVVTHADLAKVAHRIPRRPHDPRQPRDHLPGLVCAGPRRAGPLPAHRPGQAPAPWPGRPHRADHRHGDDQRTLGRGR
jgi:IS30 family transposase